MLDTVAVIGLGAMGLPMAARLAEKFDVRGFDLSQERRMLASRQGVTAADSAAEAATGADVILLAVRTSDDVRDLLFESGDLVAQLAAGAVVVLTSTVGAQGVGALARRLEDHGVLFVDAPLSGGPRRAERGDLLIVVGAGERAIDAARPVLEQLSSTLKIVGPNPGDGQALKTVNQLLCGVHIAAAAEALALADALGLDRERTLEALEAGAAGSFMLSDRGRRMLRAHDQHGAEVLSRLDIFVKDLGIVGDAAREHRLAVPVAAAAEQLFLLGEAQGLGAVDDSGVIRVIAPSRRV